MTALDALRSINAYPIPLRTLQEVCERRGLTATDEVGIADLTSPSFLLAKADLLLWLSYAPNVSQGGQSYSFTDEQRKQFRNEAQALFDENGVDESAVTTKYGYKGDRL